MTQKISLIPGSVLDSAPVPPPLDVLWVAVSPSLRAFDQPLLRDLAQHHRVARWEYEQAWDEPSCLDLAVDLLHDYLRTLDRPVHLVGHGLGGVLALTYAQHAWRKVRSLSLLAVSPQPAATWHAHYYVQRHLLSAFSQPQLLAHLSRSLFGGFAPYPVPTLVKALARDLDLAPSCHSLYQICRLPRAGVASPLLVCGSATDPIVSPSALEDWQACLKRQDELWSCPDGRHFFHFAYPKQTGDRLRQFWQCVEGTGAIATNQQQTQRQPLPAQQIATLARVEDPSSQL